MDKKSKVILGLEAGKIIQKANKYFSEPEKHFIIQELLATGCTKAQIWEKYTGQLEEHGQLLRWMRQLGYDTSIKTRIPNFDTKTTVMPKKKAKKENNTIFDDFETLQLKKRIAILEKSNAHGLAIKGNNLYISEARANGSILKIDLTETTPTVTNVVSGLNGPFALAFNGNDLYIAEFYGDKISKLNVTETIPTVSDVVSGLNKPWALAFNGNDLYIAETFSDKISKFTTTLSTIDYSINNSIKIHPNPTKENFTILFKTVENEAQVSVTNSLGQLIHKENYKNTQEIELNIQGTQGFYYVNVVTSNGTSESFKIIKD